MATPWRDTVEYQEGFDEWMEWIRENAPLMKFFAPSMQLRLWLVFYLMNSGFWCYRCNKNSKYMQNNRVKYPLWHTFVTFQDCSACVGSTTGTFETLINIALTNNDQEFFYQMYDEKYRTIQDIKRSERARAKRDARQRDLEKARRMNPNAPKEPVPKGWVRGADGILRPLSQRRVRRRKLRSRKLRSRKLR